MNFRDAMHAFYRGVQKRLVPRLCNSQYHYLDTLRSSASARTRWLDLGCGHRIVPPWMNLDEPAFAGGMHLAVGADLDEASLKQHTAFRHRVVCDLTAIPFCDGAFNLITTNMVVEHLQDPVPAFREIRRLLRPGGCFVVHTPNLRNYQSVCSRLLPQRLKERLLVFLEGAEETDIYPTFYRVNTQEDLRRAAAQAGLEVVEIRMVNTSAKLKMLGPLVIFELLWIRLTEMDRWHALRSDMIAILRNPCTSS